MFKVSKNASDVIKKYYYSVCKVKPGEQKNIICFYFRKTAKEQKKKNHQNCFLRTKDLGVFPAPCVHNQEKNDQTR